MPISEYDGTVARSSTTSDVFNAVAEARRREILDTLIAGEKAVGTIVNDLSLSQPQVSKHLRVLSEVGLVLYRPEELRRLQRVAPGRLRNRVLVSGHLLGGRAADPDRRDVAVRRVARCGRRRVRGSARNRRSDEADDEAGVPRQGWP